MKSKLLHEAHGLRTFAVVLDIDDEVSSCLQGFSASQSLSAAQISAIGAFREAVISYFDWESKSYLDIPLKEQLEVLSLNGDIALDQNGKPKLHMHTVLGRRDGSTLGGHLKSGVARPTLEIILTEAPEHLRRKEDPVSGLALISID